jgi:hypothetical protein
MEREFFREIDFPDALELIAEKFDNAVNLIGSNGVVYGGAIRDLIAGFPLSSDLDIACSYNNHKYVVKAFDNSEKWVRGNFRRRKHKSVTNPFDIETHPFLKSRGRNPYEKAPISSVVDFYSCDNMKVQLMRPAVRPDGLGPAVEVVKAVDIACCGLMMDASGRIFEVIEGAYHDCNDRVLRLNERNPNVDVKALKERIRKLEERGWLSKINMRKLVRNARKAEEAKKKHMQKMMEEKKKMAGVYSSGDCARVKPSKRHNIAQFITNRKNFVVKVYRTPLDEYFGTRVSMDRVGNMVREAARRSDLSGSIETTPECTRATFPIEKMMSHKQMEVFEKELGSIVEDDRDEIIYNKERLNQRLSAGKPSESRRKWKKLSDDSSFMNLAKKAIKSPPEHKHSGSVYKPVAYKPIMPVHEEATEAEVHLAEPIADEDIPRDMSPTEPEPPIPKPDKPKKTKRTKRKPKAKGGIIIPPLEKPKGEE